MAKTYWVISSTVIDGLICFRLVTKPKNTTAIAPVAPEIIPGLPPKMAVTIPIIKAAYKPVKGDSPAMSAKATASGTNAIATVNPDKTSVL